MKGLYSTRAEAFTVVTARSGKKPRGGPYAVCTAGVTKRERRTYTSELFARSRLDWLHRNGRKDWVIGVWRNNRWEKL